MSKGNPNPSKKFTSETGKAAAQKDITPEVNNEANQIVSVNDLMKK